MKPIEMCKLAEIRKSSYMVLPLTMLRPYRRTQYMHDEWDFDVEEQELKLLQ